MLSIKKCLSTTNEPYIKILSDKMWIGTIHYNERANYTYGKPYMAIFRLPNTRDNKQYFDSQEECMNFIEKTFKKWCRRAGLISNIKNEIRKQELRR